MDKQPQEIILKICHLKTYLKVGKTIFSVVDDLSFDLLKGKTVALLGESGCGKSMTAHSLMRILPSPPVLKVEGEVWYKGTNLLTLKEKEMRKIRGGKIAMIFQDPHSALNPVYRIGDQLVEAAEIHRDIYGEDAFEVAVNALKEVGIQNSEQRFYAYPHELSGGMKQRVMIAMALIGEPDILIADEPTTALDVTIQAQVLELMKELQRKRGMAILLITHDMGVVAKMADECLVMYAAKGVEQGSVQEILEKRAHPYTQALFKARPTYEVKRGELEAIKGSVPPMSRPPSGCRFHPRCPYVMPKCKEGEVPAFHVANDKHYAKCWLLE